jgi:glutathione S-transferase
VPALDTGEGWILTQVGAVLRYLARRFPAARLGSDGSLREDAELDRWSHFLTGDLHPAFFPLFAPQRYTTARDKDALEAVQAAAKDLVEKKLDLIDRHLAAKDHVLGDRRTLLDAYVLPMFRWARSMLPHGLERHANCERASWSRSRLAPRRKRRCATKG